MYPGIGLYLKSLDLYTYLQINLQYGKETEHNFCSYPTF